jgi:hypothetical protein
LKAAALFIRITPLNCKLHFVKGSINDTLLLLRGKMKFILGRSIHVTCRQYFVVSPPIKRNERDTILLFLAFFIAPARHANHANRRDRALATYCRCRLINLLNLEDKI